MAKGTVTDIHGMDKKRGEEVRRLASWRKDAWLALGFKSDWASFLADTQVDVHIAGRMMDRGATRDQVVRILAGYGPLAPDPLYDWNKHDSLLYGIPEVEADEEQVEEDEEHVAVGSGDSAVATD